MQVIIKPLITEQSMQEVPQGKYTFIVNKFATKPVIKQAVKDMFNVTVRSVATSIVKGRTKRVGARRQEVTAGAYKKATVTLKKGEKISMFEPGASEEAKK